jgi:hypothetical protein
MYRGRCAVVLAPVEHGGLKVKAVPSVLIDGHFGVRLKRAGGDVFVWKAAEVSATSELLAELDAFRKELNDILDLPPSI